MALKIQMLLVFRLLVLLKQAYLLGQKLLYFCYFGSKLVLRCFYNFISVGYILGFNKNKYYVRAKLKYSAKGLPSIKKLQNLSQPTKFFYASKKHLQTFGYGLVLSTKFGILSAKQANYKQVGGRILCQIF